MAQQSHQPLYAFIDTDIYNYICGAVKIFFGKISHLNSFSIFVMWLSTEIVLLPKENISVLIDNSIRNWITIPDYK